MPDESHKPSETKQAEERFHAEIARKAARHRMAERERDRGFWFSLGLFGLVGWSVVIPALIGIGVGLWLDKNWPSRVSWTLTLLFVGITVGCLNAWYWIKQESRKR
jgi:ATP synthase protein I